jgi:hypothetical protein
MGDDKELERANALIDGCLQSLEIRNAEIAGLTAQRDRLKGALELIRVSWRLVRCGNFTGRGHNDGNR